MCKYKYDLCVQVKNKPKVEFTIIMRLISWIHSRGSEAMLTPFSQLSMIPNIHLILSSMGWLGQRPAVHSHS
jgi:hypothetical protein